MKGYGKRLMAKLLCLSLVFQLGAFQAEAAVTETVGLCEHKHTKECYGDVPVCGYEEEDTASGSNAVHTHTSECYELDCSHENGEHDETCGYEEDAPYSEDKSPRRSEMEVLKSSKKTLTALEENKDNFTIGTQSRITSDIIGGNVLEVTNGWHGDRRSGVIEFKNAGALFKKEAFTLNAYVYSEADNEKASAFTIGNESDYFSINLKPGTLKYASSDQTEQTVQMGDYEFINEWISLTISYSEGETEGSVAVYADGEEILPETEIGFKMSGLDIVKAYIGGTFADTSFMGKGKYDHITVSDQAAADGFDRELASASNASYVIEDAADEYDFASTLKGCENQAEAEAAVEKWVAKEFSDILESGMTIRTTVSEYEAAGEPYRESFEGKAGSIIFSFKILNGSAAVTTGEKDSTIGAAGNAGEIPVYDSFSGTADGVGSGSKERSFWLDTEGTHIQAHGGQVQCLNEQEVEYDLDDNGSIEDKNVWLWYGEDKTRNGKPIDGVRCYVSTDLYNWTNKGTVLRTHDLLPAKISEEGKFSEGGVALDEEALDKLKSWSEMGEPTDKVSQGDIDMAKEFLEAYIDTGSDTGYDEENLELAFWNLYTGYCIAERPKMLYNEETGQYIVVYHQDAPYGGAIKTYVNEVIANGSSSNTGSRYSRASMGFAVSDSPFGPFKLINVQRLNGLDKQGDAAKLGMARDMNVFLDDTDIDKNGVKDAYAIYSSEENAKMYISLLNEDYTGPATEGTEQYLELEDGSKVQTFATRVLPDNSREAPAVFKYNGYYYMITSGTSGWNPNRATYYRAENIFGPWEAMGDPCEGGSGSTFRSQSTCVFPLDAESGQFIYMGDRWRTESGSSALWYSSYMWAPVQITNDNRIVVKKEADWDLSLMDKMGTVKINTELPETVDYGSTASLPGYLNVTISKKTFDTPVVWTKPDALGSQSITGTLTDLDRNVSFQADVVARDVVYFADCGAASGEGRDYYSLIESLSSDTMKNADIPDQAYTVENGWGYEGNNTKARNNGDLYEMLRYVSGGSGRDLSYRFDQLEPGNYSVYLGFYSPTNWPSDNRTAKISVKAGEKETASAEHKISCGVKDMEAFENITLDEKGSLKVVISPKNSGSNTDIQVSYIAVCRKPVITVETEWKAVDMNNPVMPETITVSVDGAIQETHVTWNQAELAGLKKSVGVHTINGIMTDIGNRPVTVEITSLPANAVYFVDCGSKEVSSTFGDIVKMSADRIKNPETPDQAYTEGSWGYEGDETTARESGSDLYEMLRYVKKNASDHNIRYRFDSLEPGVYEVCIGFFDPWYQYSKGNRKAEITAVIDGEQQGKAVTHTITSAKDMVKLSGLETDGEGTLSVNLNSVNQGNDTDVMVSYIAVCRTADIPEDIYYTVRFETNGGSETAPQTVKEGEYAEEVEAPVRDGYRFAGWYRDASLTEAWDYAAAAVMADITVYAKWEKEEPEVVFHTVKFETNGGSAIDDQTVKDGGFVKEPVKPIREGFHFAGWYKNADFTEAWNFATDTVTADTTVYTKWEREEPEIVCFTISFVTNGGSEIENQIVKRGDKAIKPEDPKREGYHFDGWYKDSAWLAVWDFAEESITADTIIYAKWIKEKSDVSEEDHGSNNTGGGTAVSVYTVLTIDKTASAMEGSWEQSSSGKWYFIKEDGSRAAGEWGRINGRWYLFGNTSEMVTGWAMVNNVWYYLDAANGDMKSDWQFVTGKWYYLDPVSGAMKTGWQTVNGKWYYLDPDTGEMKTGRITVNGKTYDLNSDGSWIE